MSNPKKTPGKKVSGRPPKDPEMILAVRRSVGFTTTEYKELNEMAKKEGARDVAEIIRRVFRLGLDASKKNSK